MIIDTKNIASALDHSLFRLSYVSARAVFGRRVGPSLFESVSIGRGTRRNGSNVLDIVGASVLISVVPGRTAVKGISMGEYLPLPSCDRSGYCTIVNEQDATRWLGELSVAAPLAARTASQKHGAALLSSSAEIRAAAESYLERIPPGSDIEDRFTSLRSLATNAQLAEANAWSRQRVVMIPGGSILYEAACLVIAIYHGEVERQPNRFTGKRADAADDRGLMLRLQYMASRLATEAGWEWPIVS